MKGGTTKAVAETVRGIARHVGAQGSAQRMEHWRAHCPRKLQLDCPTRWSSTYTMLTTALELRAEISDWRRTLKEAGHRALFDISEAQWTHIQRLIAILEPIADATSLACMSEHSVSSNLPLYNMMYYSLKDRASEPEYAAFKGAIEAGIDKLNEYYNLTSDSLAAATALDPRANVRFFGQYANRDGNESLAAAESAVHRELEKYLESSEEDSQQSTTTPTPAPVNPYHRQMWGTPRVTPQRGNEFSRFKGIESEPMEKSPYD